MIPADNTGSQPVARRRHTDITLRVDLEDRELAGELLLDGRRADRFHGWLDLLARLDRTLDALHVGDSSSSVGPPLPKRVHDG